MKIEEIDKNLKVETTLGRDDLVFMDVRNDPFRIYGLYEYKTESVFHRLPENVAAATNEGVKNLNFHTAGGRVRFATDSPVIAIRAKMQYVTHFSHMPLSGTSGFDLYIHCDDDGRDTYHATFMPPYNMKDGYDALQSGIGDGKMHTYTIHFPLYNPVQSLEIGLTKDAQLAAGAEYRPLAPVVYYGSSITQGGCASRPGNAYQNIITARNNVDHINLGFSGSARGEDVMADYIAGLPMSVFVMDYDHNAPTLEHLKNTHERFFRRIREAQPELPIIMVSLPNARVNQNTILRRGVIYDTFAKAYAAGDRNVYFIDGYTFFEPEYHDICTVDGCHPTDAGFVGMARVIGREIDRILRRATW